MANTNPSLKHSTNKRIEDHNIYWKADQPETMASSIKKEATDLQANRFGVNKPRL